MHERTRFVAVVCNHLRGESFDVRNVGEVTGVTTCGESGAFERGGACFRFFGGVIDENSKGAEFGERSGDDFAQLAFASDAGQDDGRAGKHVAKDGRC